MPLKNILLAGLVAAAPAGEAERSQDPLAVYMQEARGYDLLTQEDEADLGSKVQATQDPKAINDLVRANLRLVVTISNQYKRSGLPVEDLVQEGNVGLLKAARKFDPAQGARFSTYAGYWIRAYIIKSIMDNKRLVRIGTTQAQRKLFFNLGKTISALTVNGQVPTAEQIAAELGVKTKTVVEMQIRMGSGEASLDSPVGDDSNTLGDFQASHYGDAASALEQHESLETFRSQAAAFSENLEGRELELWTERLMADEPITLQDLGTRWGVSRERARQVEAKLIGKLRKYVKAA